MIPLINRFVTLISMVSLFIFFLFSCSADSELNSLTEEIAETEVIESDSSVDEESEVKIEEDSVTDETSTTSKTQLSIVGQQFYINGKLTYEGRYWQGKKIEGLLMNSRMVQGIFDDTNSTTRHQFAYPDTNAWDADRNTDEFIAHMAEWKSKGLLAFTLNLQGGSPTGYGNKLPWINSAFDAFGNIKSSYRKRLERILDEADRLQMAVILGYFYFGQDQELSSEESVINAVDNITYWILEKGYENILVEINNECNLSFYDHDILGENRVHELIQRVKNTQRDGKRLLVSTSYSGGATPSQQVIQDSDYILLHGNSVNEPSRLRDMITRTRNVPEGDNKPIIINEDDHYDFNEADNNFLAAVEGYVSWGFFDYRQQDEGFEQGFQSVPVDWGINSDRKRDFFDKLQEITGY